ncbi:hypothetical protein N7462_000227 [Penicillium macrosclerotiorum]|uniref:uncharacterized protein n=1 Tax=Penicillium macrosclerotiorum TaxID=303699 RepID=UPI0025479E5D|nr:uncharacterized protein N7462_000227 [Penicillium macrosclerotiorum]KAJ5698222.1 hypothetical protein N7462_000227 [Penicillium macrosclerotiorum]
MSPAPIAEEPQLDLHQDQLQAVGKAFDALLLTLYRLTHRHNELKQYTEEAFKQYTNVTRQLAPQDRPHAMEVQQRLLDQQKILCQGLVHNKPPVEEQSLNSMEVIKTLVSHQNVDENTTRAIVDGVKGYKALLRSDGLSQISSMNSCLLARGPDPSVSLEQDFTTNGTQGSLHCPFSKPKSPRPGSGIQNGRDDGPKIRVDTCGHDHLDPIKAEQEERRSSTTPSAVRSVDRSSQGRCPVSRCPIRYLDKHSPEEIAEYVERHKHEIPRSHAICVKRYQRDPQNMRQLDAKYGGLINMISGLSVKHQAFLPDRQTNGVGTSPSASTERVEKWAENVDPATPGPPNQVDDRDNHFDRPLREVRVGESPSRPWGIPVPIAEQPAASVPFSGSVSGPVPLEAHLGDSPTKPAGESPAKPAGRCPFGHDAPKPEEPEPLIAAAAELKPPWSNWGNVDKVDVDEKVNLVDAGIDKNDEASVKADFNSLPAHVTFNGPVFFGYSAEQTASLMQQLGHLNLGKS